MRSNIPGTFRIISVLLFFSSLMLFYGFSPDRVELIRSGSQTIDREMLFYIAIGSFLVTNVFLVFSSRLVRQMRSPTSNSNLSVLKADLRDRLSSWLISFCGVLNLNYAFLIAFVGLANYDENIPILLYSWLVYVGVLLIIIWIYLLFKIFNRMKPIPTN